MDKISRLIVQFSSIIVYFDDVVFSSQLGNGVVSFCYEYTVLNVNYAIFYVIYNTALLLLAFHRS